MFYEVRVLNSQGEIQKVLNPEQLSRKYWQNFKVEESNMGFKAQNNARLFKKIKRNKTNFTEQTNLLHSKQQ